MVGSTLFGSDKKVTKHDEKQSQLPAKYDGNDSQKKRILLYPGKKK